MSDDGAQLRLSIPRRPEAASAARRALASLNGDLHLVSSGRLLDVQLMATELITNAVRHGAGDDVTMVVRTGDAVLRVEVENAGTMFAEADRRAPSTERAGGWGLSIVELMAHRWGIEPASDGISVWFEIDRPDHESPLEISGEAPPPM